MHWQGVYETHYTVNIHRQLFSILAGKIIPLYTLSTSTHYNETTVNKSSGIITLTSICHYSMITSQQEVKRPGSTRVLKWCLGKWPVIFGSLPFLVWRSVICTWHWYIRYLGRIVCSLAVSADFLGDDELRITLTTSTVDFYVIFI